MNNKELKLIRQLLFFSAVDAANDISKTSVRTWQRWEKGDFEIPDDVIKKTLLYVKVYNKMLASYDASIAKQLQNNQIAEISYKTPDSKQKISDIAKKNLHKSVCAAMKVKYSERLLIKKEKK